MNNLNILAVSHKNLVSIRDGMNSYLNKGAYTPEIHLTSAERFLNSCSPLQLYAGRNLGVVEFPKLMDAQKMIDCYHALDWMVGANAFPTIALFPNYPGARIERFVEKHQVASVTGTFDLTRCRGENGLFAALRQTSFAPREAVRHASSENCPPLELAATNAGADIYGLTGSPLRLTPAQTKLVQKLSDGNFHGTEVLIRAMGYTGNEIARHQQRNLDTQLCNINRLFTEALGFKPVIRQWGIGLRWIGPKLAVGQMRP